MKKRLLTLLLLGSSPASAEPARTPQPRLRRAEPGAPTTTGVRGGALPTTPAVQSVASGEEIASDREVDPATVARVFGARIGPESRLLEDSIVEQHPAWFEVPRLEERRARRKVWLLPARFKGGGRGLKVKIPI